VPDHATTYRHINIDGYTESNGIVHVLATDLVATRDCLLKAGFRELQEQHVVVVEVENQPGAAARVFQKIADAHINLKHTYMATGNRLVIAAADAQKVIDAVSK
jgi:hypothetical protein